MLNNFASGSKRHYYGKGDVIVYRVERAGSVPPDRSPVLGARILMLVHGDAFWPAYTAGDNTGLIATDSMKNFIQRETLNFEGSGLDELCRFLSQKFLARYPQVEGTQITAEEIPYERLEHGVGLVPGGPERTMTRIESTRTGVIEAVTGIHGFRLLRPSGSSFKGFVRDEYTTLPDLADRPLHMWLDVEWRYVDPEAACNRSRTAQRVRSIVRDVFETIESGSIQQVIYQMGTKALAEVPEIAEIHLEANNRTWDTVAERGNSAVYTDPRPPYGCLGLRLTRQGH
jgi:urate oxidase/2-oxo-4-hydroxy-4-carboxy-5-ureidoimidazoline decarboxylase